MDALKEPRAQGVATVILPPTAGVGAPLLSQLPLGLLAVAAHAGGLTTGLRVRTTRVVDGSEGTVRASTVDLTRDRTFRALLEHLDSGTHDGDSQLWLSVAYRVGVAALPAKATTPIELGVAAGTAGFRCTVRCDPAALEPSWADRITAGMLVAGARVAGDLDRRLSELAAAVAGAPSAAVAGSGTGPASGRLRSRPDLPTPLVLPRTQLEQQLVALWQRVLEVDELGVDDDFFELGGHSLMAAALLRHMQEAVGTDLPVDTLYLQPTVAAVAAEIEASRVQRSLAET